MFLVFRMANSNLLIFLRFQYSLINTFVKGDSLSPILEDALPFCPFGTFPHTVGNHPAELSQLDRSRLRRNCIFVIMRNIPVLCRLFRLPLPATGHTANPTDFHDTAANQHPFRLSSCQLGLQRPKSLQAAP